MDDLLGKNNLISSTKTLNELSNEQASVGGSASRFSKDHYSVPSYISTTKQRVDNLTGYQRTMESTGMLMKN